MSVKFWKFTDALIEIPLIGHLGEFAQLVARETDETAYIELESSGRVRTVKGYLCSISDIGLTYEYKNSLGRVCECFTPHADRPLYKAKRRLLYALNGSYLCKHHVDAGKAYDGFLMSEYIRSRAFAQALSAVGLPNKVMNWLMIGIIVCGLVVGYWYFTSNRKTTVVPSGSTPVVPVPSGTPIYFDKDGNEIKK